jgi:hypothetical protein
LDNCLGWADMSSQPWLIFLGYHVLRYSTEQLYWHRDRTPSQGHLMQLSTLCMVMEVGTSPGPFNGMQGLVRDYENYGSVMKATAVVEH